MAGDDRGEIIQLLNLYAFMVDTQCWDLFDRVFTPDIEADYGGGAHWTDSATFRRDFDFFHATLEGSQHTVTNHQVLLEGDTANAMSYVVVKLLRRMPSGGDGYWEAGGWYDDQLVRTTGGWRIKKRQWRGNWWTGNPQVGEPTKEIRFEPAVKTLRHAAAANAVSYLQALRRLK